MKYTILIFSIISISASCSQHTISYNPFNPNVNITLRTIIKNGFEVKFAEDVICYNKFFDDSEIFFYYDPKVDKVIGEGYYFFIDSLVNVSDSAKQLLRIAEYEHDFEKAKPKIEHVLERFDGKITSKPTYRGYTKNLKFFAKDTVYNKVIECDLIYKVDYKEVIYIENFFYE